MRLGQLSRQLNVDTNKIVKFLGKEKIDIEDSPNAKLDEDQIKLVEAHFVVKEEVVEVVVEEAPKEEAPVSIPDPTIDVEKESSQDEAEVIELENKEELIEEKKEDVSPTKIDLTKFEAKSKPKTSSKEKNFFPAEDPQEDEITNAELLPTEKVTLEGIKVVGKIDLPEKPKKETKQDKEETPTVETQSESNDSPASENTSSEVIDETHPLKKAKLVGIKESKTVKQKATTINQVDPKKPFKGIKAKEIKAKKKEQDKKNFKKKKKEFVPKKVEVVNAPREARQRKKERQKEAALNQKEKSWWTKLWESFSL